MTQKQYLKKKHELTDEQKKILEASRNMEKGEILQVTACAGSGKTSTLAETAKANPSRTFLYLAFNKAAAEDAAKKFPKNVEVRTVHSAAYREMVTKGPYKGMQIMNIRAYDVMTALGTNDYFFARDALEKYTAFLHSDEEKARGIAEILYELVEDKKLPLTHDHYLKAFQIRNLARKNFGKNHDYLMLDEAQDSNDVTMSLFLNNGTRRIIVGDPNQQIYAFRGAVNIMDKIHAGKKLTLSTSFRCPENVIARCNALIREYKPDSYIKMSATHPGEIKLDQEKKTAFLSRCNARLISCFSSLIDDGKIDSVRFERDPDRIFTPALCVLDLMNGDLARSKEMSFINNFEDLEDLTEYAEDTNDMELLGAITLAKNLGDRLEPLYGMAKMCYRKQNKEERDISLSTAHSSKGLEWENVVILDDFVPLEESAADVNDGKMTQEELNEEVNLFYVTCTRSIQNIIDASGNMRSLLRMKAITQDDYDKNENLSERVIKDKNFSRQQKNHVA